MEEHLGDGVYASFDGYHIWLNVQRENGWERVAIEPSTFRNLLDFAKRLSGFQS